MEPVAKCHPNGVEQAPGRRAFTSLVLGNNPGKAGFMVILIILVVATLLARLTSVEGIAFLDSWSAATRVGLAVMLLFSGSAHFNSMRHDLARMVPPAIPHAMGMIYFTGICEIAGGIGLLSSVVALDQAG